MARCSLCACCKAPEALVLLLWLTGCSPILLLRMSEEATLASYTLGSTQPIVWTLSLADSWAAESAGDPFFLVSCFILPCCLHCSSPALAGNQQKSRWQWQYPGHGNQQVSYRQIQIKTCVNLPGKNVENSAENPEPIPMSSNNLPQGYCYRFVLECCILHDLFLYTGLACSTSSGALWLENSGSWLLLPCFWFSHAIASYGVGMIADYDYRQTARAYNLSIDRVRGDDLAKFPIEKARLRTVWLYILLSASATLGYGWTLQYRTHLAAPLAMQFLIDLAVTGIFNVCNTLVVDLHSDQAVTASASVSITRCAAAAAGVSVLQLSFDAIGPGWTFAIIAGLGYGVIPILWLERKRGWQWRLERS